MRFALRNYTRPLVIGFSMILAILLIFLLIFLDQKVFHESNLGFRKLSDYKDVSSYLEVHQIEYMVWTMKENVEHHEWNLRSTKILFWLSIFVSISGIIFSFWQFSKADEFERRFSESDEVVIKNSTAEISFKSRSIASFVLVLSLVYLIIYVKFLYPIEYSPVFIDNREKYGGYEEFFESKDDMDDVERRVK